MSKKQKDHNQGQKDGARGNWVTDIIRETSRMVSGTSEYQKGSDNGVKNRPKK